MPPEVHGRTDVSRPLGHVETCRLDIGMDHRTDSEWTNRAMWEVENPCFVVASLLHVHAAPVAASSRKPHPYTEQTLEEV